ncbi:MAG: hypothetical protein KY453_03750 [Gemmatimonadetes bacterium]|nr:hypothetical protein [Gemmatimonadota bacterium]
MPTWILGISAFYHDAAACLVRDGEIVAAAQEERFSRVKHDPSFPAGAARYCLAEAGITPARLDHVAFYEKPWIKFERLLETSLAVAPRGLRPFLAAMPVWLKEKLWIEQRVHEELEGWEGDLLYTDHHTAHAASAFFPSPFPDAAVLTMDGVGEWTTTAWGVGEGNQVRLEREVRFPSSLGLLYSAATYYLGFRVNDGEYKVMGLAPYGEPRFVDALLEHVVDLREDGSFRMDLSCFDYLHGLRMTGERFHRLMGGPPRSPEEPLTQRHMDVARSVQWVTEEAMVRAACHVAGETGHRRLCLAGGVALNSVGNGRILREGAVDDLWIQPAAGDAGGALGAALWAWHQHLGRPRQADGVHDRQKGSYLGPSYAPDAVAAWLEAEGIPHRRLSEETLLHETAAALDAGAVVGWLNGRMEYGPRALGARSILADARDPDMQRTLNLRIKERESFRPFAPSCLAEDAGAYFDLDAPSPYMLLVAPVREERRRDPGPDAREPEGLERVHEVRSDLPAVTHVDHSARIQTVEAAVAPRYHALLRHFRARTGYGVLVNTSFNVAGEPIVCTPVEAYRDFLATGMDVLVLEDCLLRASEQGDRRAEEVEDDPFRPPHPATAEEDRDTRRRHLRRFGLIMSGALGALGGFFWWRERALWPWLVALGALFALTGLLSPGLLDRVERGWMALGERLGGVVTRVLLSLTFFLGVTPLGLAGRLVGRRRLALRPDPDTATYWTPAEDHGARPHRPY